MCGIVGYVGEKACTAILLDGLRSLEYRGYDSAGLAVLSNGAFKVLRRQGNLAQLENALGDQLIAGSLGIGHTRWATHGAPSEENAHPHLDCEGRIALVHNGIIENYLALKEELAAAGHKFKSETDTEVLAHLVEDCYDGDLVEAVRSAVKKVDGSFALAVISRDHPEHLVATRRDSPLVLGLGSGEYFVASDIPALLKNTRQVIILDNSELALLTPEGPTIWDRTGQRVERAPLVVDWDAEAAEKSGYEDFMLKEIYEQPEALTETLRGRDSGTNSFLEEIGLSKNDVKKFEKVFIVACGTSHYAAMLGQGPLEEWAGLPVEVEISSEFRYRLPRNRCSPSLMGPSTLVVAITQSGETADTMAALREAQRQGAKVLAITNVVGSSASREADAVLYTRAGPEIGVVATKTFTSQMMALYLLAFHLAGTNGSLTIEEKRNLPEEMRRLPNKVRGLLEEADAIKILAGDFASSSNFLFLGRGSGVPVAMEGALKLKEVSYIHAEGYPAGEMKHGPIALIEKNLPVVVVATKSRVYDKVIGNIQEVKARGARVLALATEGDEEITKHADHVVFVPDTPELLVAVPAVVPLQLFSYFIAKQKGLNVDQPRNLAKSVTVE